MLKKRERVSIKWYAALRRVPRPTTGPHLVIGTAALSRFSVFHVAGTVETVGSAEEI